MINQRTLMFSKKILVLDGLVAGLIHLNVSTLYMTAGSMSVTWKYVLITSLTFFEHQHGCGHGYKKWFIKMNIAE